MLAARPGGLWFNKQLIRNRFSLNSERHLLLLVRTLVDGNQVQGQSLAMLSLENAAENKPQMISFNKLFSEKYSS